MNDGIIARVLKSSSTRAIATTSAITAVGYGASLLRDMTLAATYGGTPALDIFFVALTPALYWGTEASTLSYLSSMPELVGRGTLRPTARLASTLVALALVGSLCLVFLGVYAPSVLAPGLVRAGERQTLGITVTLLALLIPLLTIGGMLRAGLEYVGRFAFWASLPASRSLGVVILALLTRGSGTPVWLAVGLLGGILLWLLAGSLTLRGAQAPTMPSTSKRLPSLLVPLALGLILGQLNSLADNHYASMVGIGGIQALALAVNLLAVPQGLVGGVVAAVYFPRFAAAYAAGDESASRRAVSHASRLTVLGLLPPVLILVSPLGEVLTQAIYGRGRYDITLIGLTSACAAALAIGQIGFALLALNRQFLVAARRPWSVLASIVVAVAFKIAGNAILVQRFGLPGIALASSLSSLLAMLTLVLPLRRALDENSASVPRV